MRAVELQAIRCLRYYYGLAARHILNNWLDFIDMCECVCVSPYIRLLDPPGFNANYDRTYLRERYLERTYEINNGDIKMMERYEGTARGKVNAKIFKWWRKMKIAQKNTHTFKHKLDNEHMEILIYSSWAHSLKKTKQRHFYCQVRSFRLLSHSLFRRELVHFFFRCVAGFYFIQVICCLAHCFLVFPPLSWAVHVFSFQLSLSRRSILTDGHH